MRLLVYTTLFPWPGMPHHGVFVLERLKAYLARTGSTAVVIAPVPYLPRLLARGSRAVYRDVPFEETRDGIRVLHPRYPLIPKISMSAAPISQAWAGRRALRRLLREGESFDLVDAHYLYPDAVAAVSLARALRCPLVVTARGTDVNLIPQHAVPRRWLRWMLGQADAGITVCAALRDAMRPLHAADLPVTVLGNGVDLDKFRPLPRDEARRARGWQPDGPLLLSVGHLIERKGHHHLIEALPGLPEVQLKIVGEGPDRRKLRRLAEERGVSARVELVGALPHAELRTAYAAADVLALMSSREGWPNVLLESMACGTPVLATRVWGSPEVVREDAVGLLLERPDARSIQAGVRRLLDAPRDREAVRRYAEQHSWERVADGMSEVFAAAVARFAARAASAAGSRAVAP